MPRTDAASQVIAATPAYRSLARKAAVTELSASRRPIDAGPTSIEADGPLAVLEPELGSTLLASDPQQELGMRNAEWPPEGLHNAWTSCVCRLSDAIPRDC